MSEGSRSEWRRGGGNGTILRAFILNFSIGYLISYKTVKILSNEPLKCKKSVHFRFCIRFMPIRGTHTHTHTHTHTLINWVGKAEQL